MKRVRQLLALAILLLTLSPRSGAQQPSPAPPPVTANTADFERTADEVLDDVSKIIALPVKHPLKKSIRTRDEIRQFIIREMDEDRPPEKRYADRKVLEKFGLIPKGFDLDGFFVDLLTEQIAGLYDPKEKEFFIADWIPIEEQRIVMAHELVHALHDQHFDLDTWMKAARPNDDAVLARDAVVEGSAIGGMFDYMLRDMKLTVRDLPDIEQIMQRHLGSSLSDNPQLSRAPLYVRDAVMFPYFAGTTFTQKVLRAWSGWADFHKVYENPPVSTQQILHPDLYLAGVAPRPVELPDIAAMLPAGWKKLDENVAGEFGLRGILKQFLGEDRALEHSRAWAGDRYAIFELEKSEDLLLVFRLRLESEVAAARMFGQYSDVLEKKYETRRNLFRRPNFFSFDTNEGSVFLYCVGDRCLAVEGAPEASGRKFFDKLVRALGWPAAPSFAPDGPARKRAVATTFR